MELWCKKHHGLTPMHAEWVMHGICRRAIRTETPSIGDLIANSVE